MKHYNILYRTTQTTAIIVCLYISILISFTQCRKNDDSGDPDQPLVFSSLKAEYDTIIPGGTSKITALAKGYKIGYNWSASAGDILGSGTEVTYLALPCQIGRNKITCTVKDGNNQSETKEIYIVVE